MFVHEFGDGALVIRDARAAVAAYLFGFFVPDRGLAYVHLVAVREDQRGQGLARRLYERFWTLSGERGCTWMKAIARPENATSVAFHHALGLDSEQVPDYSGPGRARIVFSGQPRSV